MRLFAKCPALFPMALAGHFIFRLIPYKIQLPHALVRWGNVKWIIIFGALPEVYWQNKSAT